MTEIANRFRPDILENEIIKIIPLEESDFGRLFEVASDPLIWEQHPDKNRYKKEIFQIYFDNAINQKTAFLIIDKATNSIIGSTRYYDYNAENSSIAIGFTFLVKSHWGGFYNKSCKTLLIEHAFQFVDKIYFHIGAANIRSQMGTSRIGAHKVDEYESEENGIITKNHTYLIEKKI